jgi:hypothetical protein
LLHGSGFHVVRCNIGRTGQKKAKKRYKRTGITSQVVIFLRTNSSAAVIDPEETVKKTAPAKKARSGEESRESGGIGGGKEAPREKAKG